MTRRESLVWLLVPACAVLAGLTVLPSLGVITLSLVSWKAGGAPDGPSLTNFAELLHDPWIANSLRVTIGFVVISSLVEVSLGVLVAFLLERWQRAKNVLRLLFAVPLLMSSSTVGIVWRLALNEGSGPVWRVLAFIWGPEVRPLSTASGALLTLCAIDAWQWTPFVILVVSFALDGARLRVGEISRIDQLSPLVGARHIWAPLLLPAIGLASLFRFIDCLKMFDVVQTATAGGPGAATELLPFYIYKQLISFGNFGYSATLAVVLLCLATGAFAVLSRTFFARWASQ